MKTKLIAGWYWEAFCLIVFLVLAGNQLFVRPIVGIADNSDFRKVLVPRGVCGPPNQVDAFLYVHPVYRFGYDCRVEVALVSSESIFVGAIKLFAKWRGWTSFGIRCAGVAHLVAIVIALIILFWALRDASQWLRFGLPPLVIFIFSDVAYVSYLNSFYMDTASMLFLLLTLVLAAAWELRPRTWVVIAFGVAGALLGLAKTQHAITSFLMAGLAVTFAVRTFLLGHQRQGSYWSASAIAIALAAAAIVGTTPGDYKADPLYSMIFYRILPDSLDKAETLTELGLPASYAVYSGTYAYSLNAPTADPRWKKEFVERVNYTSIAIYYLRNPTVTARLLARGLKEDAPQIRPDGFGNLLREDGFAPRAVAHRFSAWSSLRSMLLRVFPAHLVILYGVTGTGSLLCFFGPARAARWLCALVLLLTVSGTVEFMFAVLLDGTETSRHLFLFHVITEVLIVCVFAAILKLPRQRRPRYNLGLLTWMNPL